MDVHLDVLEAMAEKLDGLAVAGGAPAADAMGEFVYPLKRARQFARQFASHAEQASYKRFGEFLDRYEALVRVVDSARLSADNWRASAAAVHETSAALRQHASLVRAALQQER